MSRARWLLWIGIFGILALVLVLAQGPLRAHARAILDRVRLREREAAARLERVKARDAEVAAKQARTSLKAAAAKAQADKAAAKAAEIERQRVMLAAELAEDIPDEERASRFRKRHGLADPRGKG